MIINIIYIGGNECSASNVSIQAVNERSSTMKLNWSSSVGFGPTAWNRGGPPVVIPTRTVSQRTKPGIVGKTGAERTRLDSVPPQKP
jgi:hypothetical protein